MNLQQLANLGEFLGGIAVIVSLVYLAFQIRGSTRAQRSDTYGRSLEVLRDIQSRFATDAAYARIFNKGMVEPAVLSTEDRLKFTWACTEMFGGFEFMHYQYLQGNLPEEIWKRWDETLKFWLSFPGIQAWWFGKPSPFSAPFSALCERYVDLGYVPERPGAWEEWLRLGAVAPEKR